MHQSLLEVRVPQTPHLSTLSLPPPCPALCPSLPWTCQPLPLLLYPPFHLAQASKGAMHPTMSAALAAGNLQHARPRIPSSVRSDQAGRRGRRHHFLRLTSIEEARLHEAEAIEVKSRLPGRGAQHRGPSGPGAVPHVDLLWIPVLPIHRIPYHRHLPP